MHGHCIQEVVSVADKKTQDERIAELLKFSPGSSQDDALQQRMDKLRGTASQSGASILQRLKEVFNRGAQTVKAIEGKARELVDLASKLTDKALQNPNVSEKVQWLGEANKAKSLGQKLQDQVSTQSLHARTDKLKDFPVSQTANDTLRELKEAKSAVRNATSQKDLSVSLAGLKTAMQKVLNKSAQSEKSTEKNQLIQEVRNAKALFDFKSNQLGPGKQTPANDNSAKPKGNFPRLDSLRDKLKGAMAGKVIEAMEKYYGNKTPANRTQAMQTIQAYRQQAQLQQKTTQIKSSVNGLRNNVNEVKEKQDSTPTSRGPR